MTKPILGTFADGGNAVIDLPRLLETRMLIQANSGGGKSWAIRRLLEQTAGHVQQLVIDPEGEFATLREKYDYVIAAPHDGDALAHPRTAQLLARRLLETGVSAILDIYDLKAHERQAFVRLFCEALVNAPKALWQSALIVLDEAHVFCPEAGKAESAGAVIDLATRGRKRGYALIAATQRLAKLNKDCAAELLNKLIGRTGLDVDVKRAADELGMTAREAMEQLRPLAPGQFFGFGPALSLSVQRLKIGPVETTHPKAGDRVLRVPPKPTAAIKSVLPKLADLPKEAEQEARTTEDLRRELAAARRELTQARKGQAGSSREDLKAAEHQGYERGHSAGAQEAQRAAAAHLKGLRGALHQAVENALSAAPAQAQNRPSSAPSMPRPAPPRQRTAPVVASSNEGASLGKCERAILSVLAQFPEGCGMGKLTLLAGYRESGGFRNSLSALRTQGYIEGANTGAMRITESGLALGPFPELPQGDDLLRYWLEHPSFGKCERAILQALSDGSEMTMAELTAATNYEESGGFRNSLSALRTAGVLVGRNTEAMRLNETITG